MSHNSVLGLCAVLHLSLWAASRPGHVQVCTALKLLCCSPGLSVCSGVQVLQHLDSEGCKRVSSVLRSLPQSSILVVGQADSYVTQIFDSVDIVVKKGGCSALELSA